MSSYTSVPRQSADSKDARLTEMAGQYNQEDKNVAAHIESSKIDSVASPMASSQEITYLESRPDTPRPSPDDAWVAVMGMTGAGKSTFISTLINDQITIGHGLHSTTRSLDFYRCTGVFAKTVWLIDTPGFDDTEISDVLILQDIATYLAKLYHKGITLSGVIYLHRITDPRMSGSAIKNLEMFKLLCGQRSFPIVRLVTTRWNEVSRHNRDFTAAIDRENQLRTSPKFWQPILENGGKLFRHERLDLSASRQILDSILEKDQRIGLDIQDEMVTQKFDLDRTAAGSFLGQELKNLEKGYKRELEEIRESTEAALLERDKDAAARLEEERQEYLSKTRQVQREQEDLRANLSMLDAKKVEEFASSSEDIRSAAHQGSGNSYTRVDHERVTPSLSDRENVPKERRLSTVKSYLPTSFSSSSSSRSTSGPSQKGSQSHRTYTPSVPLQRGTLRQQRTVREQQPLGGRAKHSPSVMSVINDFLWRHGW